MTNHSVWPFWFSDGRRYPFVDHHHPNVNYSCQLLFTNCIGRLLGSKLQKQYKQQKPGSTMKNLFFLTLGASLVGFTLGCGNTKTKSETNKKNAKRQQEDKKRKNNKNFTTRSICLKLHDVGFRNGWTERPRKMEDCEAMLVQAQKNHKNALGIFDECLTKNKREADYVNCVKPTMSKEGR